MSMHGSLAAPFSHRYGRADGQHLPFGESFTIPCQIEYLYMDHWRKGWLDFLGAARDYVAAVLLALVVASILTSDCKIQYYAFFVPALDLNL